MIGCWQEFSCFSLGLEGQSLEVIILKVLEFLWRLGFLNCFLDGVGGFGIFQGNVGLCKVKVVGSVVSCWFQWFFSLESGILGVNEEVLFLFQKLFRFRQGFRQLIVIMDKCGYILYNDLVDDRLYIMVVLDQYYVVEVQGIYDVVI